MSNKQQYKTFESERDRRDEQKLTMLKEYYSDALDQAKAFNEPPTRETYDCYLVISAKVDTYQTVLQILNNCEYLSELHARLTNVLDFLTRMIESHWTMKTMLPLYHETHNVYLEVIAHIESLEG